MFIYQIVNKFKTLQKKEEKKQCVWQCLKLKYLKKEKNKFIVITPNTQFSTKTKN